MHLDLDSHPHPHPHPDPHARRSLLPWILILSIMGAAAYLALQGAPEHEVLAHFHKGVGLLEQYDYAGAYEVFAQVARARPEWDAVHANAGFAALNLREEHLQAAEKHFREALRLHPKNLHARFGLGILLKHVQRLDESFEAFREVARADPSDPHALYEYGAALQERGDLPGAKEALERAVRLQPAFGSALYRLSRVYLALKEMESFKQVLLTFQALEAGKEGIKSGDIYGEGGKYYTAIRDPLPRSVETPAPRLERPAGEGSPLGAPTRSGARPDGSPAPPALAAGDLNGDGALDVVLCTEPAGGSPQLEVFHGAGDGTFASSPQLGVSGRAAALGDLDGDSDLDLALADLVGLRLLWNDGSGFGSSMLEKAIPAGAGFPVAVLVFDADSDWDLDILVARQVKEGDRVETTLSLLQNNRDGSFKDIAEEVGQARLPIAARAAFFADLDGDIDQDLLFLAGKGEESLVILNDRAWRYRRAAAKDQGGEEALLGRAGVGAGLRAALAAAEGGASEMLLFDRSGRPFSVRAKAGERARVGPPGEAPRSWIGIDLNGPREARPGDKWSNLSGIGATVEVRAGERVEVAQVTAAGAGAACGPHRLRCDLAGARRADYVRILWPDGVLQSELGLEANRVHRIDELQRKPSSCPIVFAWDGERFRYVADFLGVGGLGYLEAPGVYSKPDPTEVLELPPLAPAREPGRPPEYRIRILEPLEECTYLDAVELVAVDAPAAVRLHADEIFAVRAPQPGARLLAFESPLLPARARDHRGRDLTRALRSIDRVYAEGFAPDRRFPGVAQESHAIVLEWDAPPPAGRLTLFLFGYVEYTYSTSNFAAAQARVVLHPPTVSVERRGSWVPLREEWGFPAGTPRWTAVDLGGLLRPEDRRLKVETDMQVYWDQAFIARVQPVELGEIGRRRPGEDLASGGVRVTVLSPDSADLRFRGFPRESSPDGKHPKLYHYEDFAPTAPMKPFPGRYTRHGEVGDLVRSADDRLAVFGEGDEVALGFRADRLPSLPEGWRRSFFLAAVGYCKDMDLYTAACESVEPLPYRAMTAYPPPAGGSPHDDPARAAERAARDTRLVEPLTLGGR